ncbi:Pimeloyl-ACP methyl ester carboxylesterase [Marinobacter zhejiangensis]|uniref:Pimeloyl-ACP methyl ester carboxylesterase n=1 Tax=Marinobacter zhejiangensis TaxID=488535 RepID=A0A1I4NZW1_9GAMM|nr:Pimeloyl-ACP methyl ester carboxylesterase [Marinobacter zhejiangensis]
MWRIAAVYDSDRGQLVVGSAHTQPLKYRLQPWSHTTSAGFTVRGLRSVPSGRPLIHFIHGNGYAGLVYEHMLAPLLDHADLFISDVQGHGESDHGGRFQGWNGTASLCEEALTAVLPEYQQACRDAQGQALPVLGLGHSFGGVMTALMMARSPELFSRAVLLDPVLFSPNMLRFMAATNVVGLWRRNRMATRARKRRSHWPDLTAAHANFHERGIFRGWDERALKSYLTHGLEPQQQGGVGLKCRPEREAEIFGSYPRRLWSSLRGVQTPVHLIYGNRTYPFVGESAKRWQRMVRQVTTEVVSGGHCFMLEHPEDTAERVVRRLFPE